MAGKPNEQAGGETSVEEPEEENPLEENAGEEAEADEAEAAAEGEEKKEASGTPAKKEEPSSKKESTPWYTRRINELTAKNKRTEAENQALKAALDAKGDARPAAEVVEEAQGEGATDGMTKAQIEKLAEDLAIKKVAERKFAEDSNKIFDAGVSEFSKASFDEALGILRESTGGLTENFVEALMELDHPQRVIMALADDPDEAARILSLRPIRMAAALAKVTPKEPKKKKGEVVSGAPAPIKPVGGGNKGGKSYEDMTEEEYAAARDAELAKKRDRR